jgi:hypothetical protein
MRTLSPSVSVFPSPPQDGDSYDPAQKTEYQRVRREWWRCATGALRHAFTDLQVAVDFNAGGPAVWGEHWIKITQKGAPVAEAFEHESLGVCVRQWDGRRSGVNQWVQTIEDVVVLVRQSREAPFRAF